MWWRPSNCSLLLIYRPRKDERLSWPSWLTYSGQFTYITCFTPIIHVPKTPSGQPSAACRAQRRGSSPVKDRRSTTAPRNQPITLHLLISKNESAGLRYTLVDWAGPDRRRSSSVCPGFLVCPPTSTKATLTTAWQPASSRAERPKGVSQLL